MNKKVYLFLADGFEEIEALTVVDLLRRIRVDVDMVSIDGTLVVKGAHGIEVKADILFEDAKFDDGDMLVLPGGMPGTRNLLNHKGLAEVIHIYNVEEKYLAAICAAPSVFGAFGILKGRKATCFPGFEQKLTGAKLVNDRVVVDGHVITSRGMGTAIDFGLKLVELLADEVAASELGATIQYK